MNTRIDKIKEMQTDIKKLIKKLDMTQKEFAFKYAEDKSDVSDEYLSDDELEINNEKSYQKLKKQLTRTNIKSTDQLQMYMDFLIKQKGFQSLSMTAPLNLTKGFLNPDLEKLMIDNSLELTKLIKDNEG